MKIALVGGAPTWKDAPYDDASWCVWAHASCQPLHLPRVDRWFDLHTVDVWRQGKAWYRPMTGEPSTYVGWLAAQTAPVMMQEQYPIVPTSFEYPIREIVEAFDIVPASWGLTTDDVRWWELVTKRGNFTCTAAYMLALALFYAADEIALYGIDFWGPDDHPGSTFERSVQRSGAKYWVGIARGLGVPVTVARDSYFEYQPFLYGYERQPEGAFSGICA